MVRNSNGQIKFLHTIGRFTCLEKTILFERFNFFPINAEMRAFSRLKAHISAKVSKKNVELAGLHVSKKTVLLSSSFFLPTQAEKRGF